MLSQSTKSLTKGNCYMKILNLQYLEYYKLTHDFDAKEDNIKFGGIHSKKLILVLF